MYDLNYLRKDPTLKTKSINEEIYRNIDFFKLQIENQLASQNAMVKVEYPIVYREGSPIPVWDLRGYKFLNKPRPYSVNPKLWEQGKLNMNAGLFKVTNNIYQVRGYDLANITFLKGKNGWIVIDCLTTRETAKAAVELVNDYFGEVPISAVIITHTHVDHYGGVLGILEGYTVDNIKVYAPSGFMNKVIEENVNAGVAMSRRGFYMYGDLLLKDEKGQVDSGIGKYVSTGTVTLFKNIIEISNVRNNNIIEKVIDGIDLTFQLTPNTEAPAEMNIFIRSERALCIAENCVASLHNIYTLRGAEVRDPVAWAKYLQEAIDLFSDKIDSIFMVHNWPRYGQMYIKDYMEKQRDMYQYINDQTLRLINKGYTLEEIGRMIKVPDSLEDEWYNSNFYGTVNHNSKAVYQKYMGWYNSNPVDLNKLFPEESAKKYVEYMGGEDEVIKKAKICYEKGEYQWVAEVMKQVIYANPNNKAAKFLCADALEQLGYIAESGPWRNEYLVGAQELRYGKEPYLGSVISEEVLDAIPLENVLYMLSIRVDGVRAGNLNYKINFIIPDRGEKASTELKRGIFRYLSNELSNEASVTVTMSKEILYELATTNNKPSSSSIYVQGDICKWQLFLYVQDNIDHNFNIITPVGK